MRGRRLVAALGAVALLAACGGGSPVAGLPAAKAPVVVAPQRRPRLVVVRSRLGPPNFALVTMGANGGNRTTLAGSTGFERLADPAWSADGGRLYFTGTSARRRHLLFGDSDVYELRAGGGGLRQITRFGDAANPVVSPDGRWLVFARYEHHGKPPFTAGLWLARADGNALRRLLPASDGAVDLPGSWSPDGRMLAFTRCRFTLPQPLAPMPCEVDAVEAGRSKPRLLAAHAIAPAFSPDGSRIAFVSDRDRNGTLPAGSDESKYAAELYVMDAGGGGQMRLTRTRELDEQSPSWSPDGFWIAYARQGPSILIAQAMRSRADGTCPSRIVGNAELRTALTFDQPSWRPGRALDEQPLRCRTG